MEIEPTEFKIILSMEKLNIIHKALSVQKQVIKEIEKHPKKLQYSEGYLEKVEEMLKETRKWW